jgi:hypothetical protein
MFPTPVAKKMRIDEGLSRDEQPDRVALRMLRPLCKPTLDALVAHLADADDSQVDAGVDQFMNSTVAAASQKPDMPGINIRVLAAALAIEAAANPHAIARIIRAVTRLRDSPNMRAVVDAVHDMDDLEGRCNRPWRRVIQMERYHPHCWAHAHLCQLSLVHRLLCAVVVNINRYQASADDAIVPHVFCPTYRPIAVAGNGLAVLSNPDLQYVRAFITYATDVNLNLFRALVGGEDESDPRSIGMDDAAADLQLESTRASCQKMRSIGASYQNVVPIARHLVDNSAMQHVHTDLILQLSWEELMYVVFLLHHRYCVVTGLPLLSIHASSDICVRGKLVEALRRMQDYMDRQFTSCHNAFRSSTGPVDPRLYRRFMTTNPDPFLNAPCIQLLGHASLRMRAPMYAESLDPYEVTTQSHLVRSGLSAVVVGRFATDRFATQRAQNDGGRAVDWVALARAHTRFLLQFRSGSITAEEADALLLALKQEHLKPAGDALCDGARDSRSM